MQNSSSKKLVRLARHVREGTLLSRLEWEVGKWRKAYEQWRSARKLRQWKVAKNKGAHIDATLDGGGRLRLYADSELAKAIYCHDFESNERSFLLHYLRPGDVFVDVGANIGLFTIVAAKIVGTDGRVYAFEPSALPRSRLEENIILNRLGNVTVEPLALSDESGELDFSTPMDGHDAWGSLATPTAGKNIQTARIQTIDWDSYAIRLDSAKPVMMKIDVEGWENHVLYGATRTLSSSDAPLLQVEFTDEAAQSAGSSCALLYQHLTDLGYVVCRYDRQSNRLVPDPLRVAYPYDNLFATKHLDLDNLRLSGVH